MRVLVVTPYYKPAYLFGGPAYSVPALCAALVEAGAAVTVLTTNASGIRSTLPIASGCGMELDGVRVRYFARASGPVPMFFYSAALARACREAVPAHDVVYISGSWTHPNWVAGREALASGRPYVWSPRGSYMQAALRHHTARKMLYYRLVEQRLLRRAAAIHCTSECEVEQSRAALGDLRFRVIPNCLDTSPFSALPVRGALRGRLGLGPSAHLSLFCGRLHREKRLDLVVECFAAVAAANPNAFLAIAGADYGEGAGVRQQVERLGIGQRVFFLGFLTGHDLLTAYADADLFVLLSIRENFGQACAEAMAAGLPALVSERVGLAGEIRRAGAGLVVPEGVDRIAPAWLALCQPAAARACGGRARDLAYRRFGSGAVARETLEFFEEITARPAGSQFRLAAPRPS